jgi:phosphotransferase system IIB component
VNGDASQRLRLTTHDLSDADAEQLADDIAAAVRAVGGRTVPAGMG